MKPAVKILFNFNNISTAVLAKSIAQCLAMSAKTKVPIFVACRGSGGSRQGRITRRPSTPTRAAPPVT